MRIAVIIPFLLVTFTGCLSGRSPKTQNPLLVFAAVSLTSVLPEISESFSREFPEATIEFNFAASSILAKQIDRGAAADIYLSANLQWMRLLAEKKKMRNDSQVPFLGNELVSVISKNSQKSFAGLDDLQGAGIQRIALADWSHVPAGIYAKIALERAGIWEIIKPKCIPALDVRAALAYVERGDADCGIVYRTDAAIRKNVLITGDLPKQIQPDIQYSAAATQNSAHPLSAAFLSFLKSPTAKRIFRESGFIIPEREPGE